MSSVLYDVPGPRAIARNRILAVVTIAIVGALVGFILWRMAVTGQFSYDKWYIFTYAAVWERVFDGLVQTLAAFVTAAIGALVLGFILAVGKLSDHAVIRVPVTVVVEVLRAIPVLIFMMLLYYGLPTIGIRMEPYFAVVIALVAYNGSVLAEVIRAGVESLPNGQKEAGYAVGLRKAGVLRLILMPQAIRAMLPVIIAQLVVTLKDTALGSIITYQELLYVAKLLGTQATYNSPIIQSAIVIAIVYISMCLLLSWVATIVERRISKGPKSGATPRRGKPVAETSTTKLIAIQAGTDAAAGNDQAAQGLAGR